MSIWGIMAEPVLKLTEPKNGREAPASELPGLLLSLPHSHAHIVTESLPLISCRFLFLFLFF